MWGGSTEADAWQSPPNYTKRRSKKSTKNRLYFEYYKIRIPQLEKKRKLPNSCSAQSARLQKAQVSSSTLRILVQAGHQQTQGPQDEARSQGVGAGSKGLVCCERAPGAWGGYEVVIPVIAVKHTAISTARQLSWPGWPHLCTLSSTSHSAFGISNALTNPLFIPAIGGGDRRITYDIMIFLFWIENLRNFL